MMRGVLEMLGDRGRASTPELCAALFPAGTRPALESTRRALRRLVKEGHVSLLGFNVLGERVFCLAAQRERLVCPWAKDTPMGNFIRAQRRHRMKQHLGWAVRLWNSTRVPLTAQ